MTQRRSAHLLVAGFWAGLCLSGVAADQSWAMSSGGTLRDLLVGGQEPQDDRTSPAPPVARYVSDEGATFVFDRSSTTPLLRFDESQEVLALRPEPAARGDVIYRDDVGDPVLRISRLGGITLFAHGRPGGAPAALEGQAPEIRLPTMSPLALGQKLLQASYRATRAAKRLIEFDAPEVTPGSEAVYADAFAVAAAAVIHISRRKDGGKLVTRFARVVFLPGARGEAAMGRGVVNITVNPSQGFAGRPSSARIVQAVVNAR